MDSLRRLAIKERPALLFKSLSRHHDNSGSDQPNDYADMLSDAPPPSPKALPNITLIRTQSFSKLLDNFAAFEVPDATFNFSDPVSKSSCVNISTSPCEIQLASHDISLWSSKLIDSHKESTNMKQIDSPVSDIVSPDFLRKFSYYSSDLSQPTDSDISTEISRQSSTSSVTPAPSPIKLPSKTSQTTIRGISNSKSDSDESTEATVKLGILNHQRETSATLTFLDPPDLNKPLPKGPGRRTPSTSRTFDFPYKENKNVLSSQKLGHQAQHKRSATLPLPLGRYAQDMPAMVSTPTPKPKRGARLGKAIANGMSRRRTNSAISIAEAEHFRSKALKAATLRLNVTRATPNQSQEPESPAQKSPQSSSSITAQTAQNVIYLIMSQLDDIKDLQSAAMISKGFYVTFQKYESNLVSMLMFKISPPAWELRRSILAQRESTKLKLKDFQTDTNSINALESLILMHCGATCRYSTIPALIGVDPLRKVSVDNALWRIWTFCILFGATAGQNENIETQVDWLKGVHGSKSENRGVCFGVGNGSGLSTSDLEDMTELWECLQALVSGYHGREPEAQRYGILDDWHPNQNITKQQQIFEWTSHILTLGLETVLSVSTCSFEAAKTLGLTKWTSPRHGQTRSVFLKRAIERLYHDRILAEASNEAVQPQIPRRSSRRPNKALDDDKISMLGGHTSKTTTQQNLRIITSDLQRKPVRNSTFRDSSHPSTAPVTQVRPDCDLSSDTPLTRIFYPATPTNDPSMFSSLNMTSTASTRVGATLFPLHYTNPIPQVPFPAEERSTAIISEVVDPVDRAMNLLVRELGFSETSSRRALAMSDNGSGLDVPRAIEILMVESRVGSKQKAAAVELPTPIDMASPLRKSTKPLQDYCGGECKRTTSILTHSRNRSTENRTTSSSIYTASPISPSLDEELNDEVPPLLSQPKPLTHNLSASFRPAATSRTTHNIPKVWKTLGTEEYSPRGWKKLGRKHGTVLGIEEYQAKVERRKSQRIVSAGSTNSPSAPESVVSTPTTATTFITTSSSSNESDRQVKAAIGRNLVDMGLGLGGFIQAVPERRSPEELE